MWISRFGGRLAKMLQQRDRMIGYLALYSSCTTGPLTFDSGRLLWASAHHRRKTGNERRMRLNLRSWGIWCVCALLSVGGTGLSSAQDVPPDGTSEKMDAVVNGIVPAVLIDGTPASNVGLLSRMAALHVPGVSIALIHNGAVTWTKGYGTADQHGAVVDTNTEFQAGSVSELFTSVAVMGLVQSGQLRLDSDVNSSLKAWHIPESNFTIRNKVTLRELLNHTAGVTVESFAGYPVGAAIPTALQTLNGISPANNSPVSINATPGTVPKHSSGGYEVVEQLVSDETGQPIDRAIKNLFDLQVSKQEVRGLDPGSNETEKFSQPYDELGHSIDRAPYIYPELAATGVWARPTDVANVALQIQTALKGRPRSKLSRASAAEIVKPGLGGMGLGLRVIGSPNHAYFEQRGATHGYTAYVVLYLNGDGAVIMTNGTNGNELADEVRRTIAYKLGWPDFQPIQRTISPVSSELTDRYVGYYQLGRYRMMSVTKRGDHLFMELPGVPAREIFPIDELVWFFADNNQIINFDISTDNVAKSVTDHLYVETSAARIDTATALKIRDELAARRKGQLKDPRTEIALRNYITRVSAGIPDYESMIPSLAATTEQQLGDL
jgi:CubicO group peptidase (beta-lactamase class C family)